MREVGKILWADGFGCMLNSGLEATEARMAQSVMDWLTLHGARARHERWEEGRLLPSGRLDTPRIPFKALETVVTAMLPKGFPIFDKHTGLKYSEALCVLHSGQMATNARTVTCMIEPLQDGHIRRRLSGTKSETLFQRTGITGKHRQPVIIKSQQLRHFLNTVAQAGNMEPFEIAAWSGRKNVSQNVVYDHVSAEERIQEVRSSMGDVTKGFAPLAVAKKYVPILRSEYMAHKIRGGHTTDLGHCVHDFAMAPCQKFGDHLSCEEHVVVKGDMKVEMRLRQSLSENQHLYDSALHAFNKGNKGAKLWLETHGIRLDRFRQIVQILDDPRVESGAIIRISITDPPSRITDAVRARNAMDGFMHELKAVERTPSNRATPPDSPAHRPPALSTAVRGLTKKGKNRNKGASK